jgi:hypothetical protein
MAVFIIACRKSFHSDPLTVERGARRVKPSRCRGLSVGCDGEGKRLNRCTCKMIWTRTQVHAFDVYIGTHQYKERNLERGERQRTDSLLLRDYTL